MSCLDSLGGGLDNGKIEWARKIRSMEFEEKIY
jgi:hypothetical protein